MKSEEGFSERCVYELTLRQVRASITLFAIIKASWRQQNNIAVPSARAKKIPSIIKLIEGFFIYIIL